MLSKHSLDGSSFHSWGPAAEKLFSLNLFFWRAETKDRCHFCEVVLKRSCVCSDCTGVVCMYVYCDCIWSILEGTFCCRQWTSFLAGASTAGYVYMYSFYYYFFKTKLVTFDTLCTVHMSHFGNFSCWFMHSHSWQRLVKPLHCVFEIEITPCVLEYVLK